MKAVIVIKMAPNERELSASLISVQKQYYLNIETEIFNF